MRMWAFENVVGAVVAQIESADQLIFTSLIVAFQY